MGSIVKSIGKAIKKVGKGLKKVVKKIGPALLVAAAVYAGVAFYGAGSMAGGLGSLSTTNFSAGLTKIGQGIGSFTSGLFNPAGASTGVGTGMAGSPTSQALFSAGTAGGTSGNIGIGTTSAGAFTGSVTSQAGAQALSKWVTAANTPSSGMTTGDALAYMTKWNMIQTGLSAVAGIYGGKDAEKQAQLTREHEEKLIQMRIDADKAADEKRYAYGAAQTPEQKSWLAQNPGWLSTHPSTRAPGTRGLMSQSAMPIQQQNIGQPTFGRQAPKNISYSPPSGSPFSGKKQGLIEQGTAQSFNPNALRRYS
jgi:hypothetical protein